MRQRRQQIRLAQKSLALLFGIGELAEAVAELEPAQVKLEPFCDARVARLGARAQVATREQAAKRQFDLAVLAKHYLADLADCFLNLRVQ